MVCGANHLCYHLFAGAHLRKKKNECQTSDSDGVVHPALRSYFTYRFYKTAIRLKAEVNLELAQHGIIGVELGILRVLDLTGPKSQVELGRGLGIDKASMVKFIDALERRGFLQRSSMEGDRRVKRIHLTAKGKKILKVGGKSRELVEKRFFAPLTKAEKKFLEEILEKLLR